MRRETGDGRRETEDGGREIVIAPFVVSLSNHPPEADPSTGLS